MPSKVSTTPNKVAAVMQAETSTLMELLSFLMKEGVDIAERLASLSAKKCDSSYPTTGTNAVHALGMT